MLSPETVVTARSRPQVVGCVLVPAGGAWSGSTLEVEWTAPVPGQQRGQVGDLVIVDARQHVGKPGLRVDVVEPGGADQLGMTAARSPPQSDPANSHDLRSRAIPQGGRRRLAAEGTVIADIGPDPPGAGLSLRQHRTAVSSPWTRSAAKTCVLISS